MSPKEGRVCPIGINKRPHPNLNPAPGNLTLVAEPAETDTSSGFDLVLPDFDGDEPEPPRHRRWGRWVFILLVLALAGTSIWIWRKDTHLPPPVAAPPPPPAFSVTLLTVQPGTVVPITGADVPTDPAAQTAFVDRISAHTDIPRRVLTAYIHAQLAVAATNPGCHLSWATLAGIGWVETQHGTWHSDLVLPSGEERAPIIGPALDGSGGMQKIGDTDHGKLDGDPVWDHAVGPMQFLPGTWTAWGTRAAGDGKPADPQNIDDATLSAGRYLCSVAGDMSVPKSWWSSLWVYNNSASYGITVYSGATAYANATR